MRRTGLLVLALLLVAASTAAAADCPRTSLGDIEDEVMCPVCGTSLALAEEAPQAIRQRAYIQRLIDDCRSKDEIKRALVAQFGESVLALPGDQGDDDLGDVLVYVVPGVALALALGGIGFAVRRWRRSPVPSPQSPGARDQRGLDVDMDRYEL